MIARRPQALILHGIDPEADCVGGERLIAQSGGGVVALSAFLSDGLRALADVVLPMAVFAETAGTFVNAEGRWQSFEPVARPPDGVRAAWKVLRVLGNRLGLTDFDYNSCHAVRTAAETVVGAAAWTSHVQRTAALPVAGGGNVDLLSLDVPMYQIDALLRRAPSLQLTADALAVVSGGAGRKAG